jgi:hypothetical protein
MTYSSPEVLQLEAIRDWMDTLDAWTDWAGADRVVWPLQAAENLPVCILGLMGGRTVNLTGAAGGSNFQPSGSILFRIYAADDAPTDPQLGYTNFADKFFLLISAMADAAHQAPVLFNEFSTSETPIVHSTWIMTEDESQGLGAYWHGQFIVKWGVEA